MSHGAKVVIHRWDEVPLLTATSADPNGDTLLPLSVGHSVARIHANGEYSFAVTESGEVFGWSIDQVMPVI